MQFHEIDVRGSRRFAEITPARYQETPSMSRLPLHASANRRRKAFTLVEILIVVVIMAVLAATIIPSFTNSVGDAKENTAVFNLNTLRSQIEHYRAQHDGAVPSAGMAELLVKTNKDGTTTGSPVYGPYLRAIPENPLQGNNLVSDVTTDPSGATGTQAWIYNTTTGQVWANHADVFGE